jgi:hypothetical protein
VPATVLRIKDRRGATYAVTSDNVGDGYRPASPRRSAPARDHCPGRAPIAFRENARENRRSVQIDGQYTPTDFGPFTVDFQRAFAGAQVLSAGGAGWQFSGEAYNNLYQLGPSQWIGYRGSPPGVKYPLGWGFYPCYDWRSYTDP